MIPLASILNPFRLDELEIFWPILVQGTLVAVALGLIGCFLVVRGLSLLGDALSHAVLPGIVIGFLIGGSLRSPWILIGASAVGLLAAAMVQGVKEHSRVKEDASLGIVFTTMFALGVLLINLYAGQADLDPGCVLYGNIEHFILDRGGIWTMAGVLALVLAGIALFYRQLLLTSFDPQLAQSLGVPVAVVQYGLLATLSLSVVASFEAVGAILAVGLLIMPGATARLWTDRLDRMLPLAAIHGLLSTIIGYWLSHEAVLDTSAGGAIGAAGFGLFLLSWLVSPRTGLVTRLLTRRRLKRRIEVENLIKTVTEVSPQGGPVTASMLAERLRVKLADAERTIQDGLKRGWLASEPRGVRLTSEGLARAGAIQRAHETWEGYLRDEVGLAPDHVHDAADWIEHYLADDRIQTLQTRVADTVDHKPASG